MNGVIQFPIGELLFVILLTAAYAVWLVSYRLRTRALKLRTNAMEAEAATEEKVRKKERAEWAALLREDCRKIASGSYHTRY